MTWQRDRTLDVSCWTNWTFGIWYVKAPRLRYDTFGIDLGPFAWVWRKR